MSRLIVIDREQIPEGTIVECDNCSETMPAGDSEPCTDAILTPGDEVPAGRCPCGGLVYVLKEGP